MKTIYKDSCGSYSITVKNTGKVVLKCRDSYGNLWHERDYKNERGAKIALARLCGGMPNKV